MSGKGSRQRPVNTEKFNSNWDKIFKKPANDKKDYGSPAAPVPPKSSSS